MNRVLAYILSAGYGSRLGGICKGRVTLDGVPLIERQLDAMFQAGVDEVRVLVGHEAEKIQAIVDDYRFRKLHEASSHYVSCLSIQELFTAQSPVPEIRESVRRAVHDAKTRLLSHGDIAGVLISLVDLALLSHREIVQILNAANDSATSVVIPYSIDDQPGHPIWIASRFLETLSPEKPEFSLREIIHSETNTEASFILKMKSADPGYFCDVDTKDSLDALNRQYLFKLEIPAS